MLYGDILSKLVFYIFLIQKHSSNSNDFQNEAKNIIKTVENMIQQIETLLIQHDQVEFDQNIVYDVNSTWEDTYNIVFPMLVLNQIMRFPLYENRNQYIDNLCEQGLMI